MLSGGNIVLAKELQGRTINIYTETQNATAQIQNISSLQYSLIFTRSNGRYGHSDLHMRHILHASRRIPFTHFSPRRLHLPLRMKQTALFPVSRDQLELPAVSLLLVLPFGSLPTLSSRRSSCLLRQQIAGRHITAWLLCQPRHWPLRFTESFILGAEVAVFNIRVGELSASGENMPSCIHLCPIGRKSAHATYFPSASGIQSAYFLKSRGRLLVTITNRL